MWQFLIFIRILEVHVNIRFGHFNAIHTQLVCLLFSLKWQARANFSIHFLLWSGLLIVGKRFIGAFKCVCLCVCLHVCVCVCVFSNVQYWVASNITLLYQWIYQKSWFIFRNPLFVRARNGLRASD